MTGMHDDQNFDSRLLNLARGEQDPQLEAHVAVCRSCQDAVFTLRQLVRCQMTSSGGLIEPPATLISQVSGLMTRIRPDLVIDRAWSGSGLAEQSRRVVANLILDTGATPLLAGLRGASSARTRQLAFVSEIADLDLEISPLEETYSVAGQFGMDSVPEGLRIRFVPVDQDPLSDDVQGAIEAEIQERGYFRVALPASEWVAMVEIADAVVIFPGVRL